MGRSKKSSTPPPTPQVQTPDIDVATVAAQQALAAQGQANASAMEDERERRRANKLSHASHTNHQPRRERDTASMMQSPTGGVDTSAVLTG